MIFNKLNNCKHCAIFTHYIFLLSKLLSETDFHQNVKKNVSPYKLTYAELLNTLWHLDY